MPTVSSSTSRSSARWPRKLNGTSVKDGDAEAEGGGDERFADAAADLADGQLLVAADELERVHDARNGAEQAEQGRQRDDGIEGAEETAAELHFLLGADLRGDFEVDLGVLQAVADDAHARVSGAVREALGGFLVPRG